MTLFRNENFAGFAASTRQGIFLALLMGLPAAALAQSQPSLDWPGCAPLQNSDFRKVELGSFPFKQVTKLALAKDGLIYGVGQGGSVGSFDPKTKTGKELGHITGIATGEWGLIGLALDPDFSDNGRIFVHCYRFIDAKTQMGELRRYTIRNGALDLASAKVILEFVADRGTVEHTGGGMAFDPQGNLFLSTGDNSAHTLSWGSVSELNWYQNSLRSAGNTNDLRGKVLRIHPKPIADSDPAPAPGVGSTYDIPPGNLFPPGTKDTRPEIYVMGNRNPFTLTVDPATAGLFWADVGPSSPNFTPEKGAAGMDEFNSAPKSGNYGWPMFVGPNRAYTQYDYINNKPGPFFDSLTPTNNSKLNTGLKVLPPSHGSLVAYGKDGKNNPWEGFKQGSAVPIAGPVYRYQGNNPSPIKLPPHFEGKWLVADHFQNWIKAIAFDAKAEKAVNVQPAFSGIAVSKVVDMHIGPDGALYIMEWDTQKISRIEYAGSCKPAVSVNPNVDREKARPYVQSLAAGTSRVDLRAGEKGFSIFDSRGKKLWSYSSLVSDRALRVDLPAGLCSKLCLIRREI